MELNEKQKKIREIAESKDILILAHSYQKLEIQDVADFVGDSLELSKRAHEAKQQKIMFAAVRFMAETASILSPEKKIMIAAPDAMCPLAAMIEPEEIIELKNRHPGVPVVCYINSTAEIKALSDIICTSANALKICESLPGKEIIFVPDQGLGSWVAEQTSKKIYLHYGFCPIHWLINPEEVKAQKDANLGSLLVVHPESNPRIRALADHITGTSGMITYAKQNPGKTFIIGTEYGMVERLTRMFPDSIFIPATQGYLCPNMKKTNLDILLNALINETTVVTVDQEVAVKARGAIERMHV